MTARFSVGDSVKWAWAGGHGEGEISEKFTAKTTCSIEGTDVTRNATSDEPAYLIEQDDGSRVLKADSELERAS